MLCKLSNLDLFQMKKYQGGLKSTYDWIKYVRNPNNDELTGLDD